MIARLPLSRLVAFAAENPAVRELLRFTDDHDDVNNDDNNDEDDSDDDINNNNIFHIKNKPKNPLTPIRTLMRHYHTHPLPLSTSTARSMGSLCSLLGLTSSSPFAHVRDLVSTIASSFVVYRGGDDDDARDYASAFARVVGAGDGNGDGFVNAVLQRGFVKGIDVAERRFRRYGRR